MLLHSFKNGSHLKNGHRIQFPHILITASPRAIILLSKYRFNCFTFELLRHSYMLFLKMAVVNTNVTIS